MPCEGRGGNIPQTELGVCDRVFSQHESKVTHTQKVSEIQTHMSKQEREHASMGSPVFKGIRQNNVLLDLLLASFEPER